jgi:hypothetical protein
VKVKAIEGHEWMIAGLDKGRLRLERGWTLVFKNSFIAHASSWVYDENGRNGSFIIVWVSGLGTSACGRVVS